MSPKLFLSTVSPVTRHLDKITHWHETETEACFVWVSVLFYYVIVICWRRGVFASCAHGGWNHGLTITIYINGEMSQHKPLGGRNSGNHWNLQKHYLEKNILWLCSLRIRNMILTDFHFSLVYILWFRVALSNQYFICFIKVNKRVTLYCV